MLAHCGHQSDLENTAQEDNTSSATSDIPACSTCMEYLETTAFYDLLDQLNIIYSIDLVFFWQKCSNASKSIMSPRELSLWSATTFTKEINSKERLHLVDDTKLTRAIKHCMQTLNTACRRHKPPVKHRVACWLV